jgi:hypothetical protein
MAAVTTQAITPAGVAPSPITPAASDTIAAAQLGAGGAIMRVITTGTATDVTVTDPGVTPLGNAGSVTPVSCPATGVRMVKIPRGALDPDSGVATVSFSGARTGVTYELYRV